jgi:hypothetical protein
MTLCCFEKNIKRSNRDICFKCSKCGLLAVAHNTTDKTNAVLFNGAFYIPPLRRCLK